MADPQKDDDADLPQNTAAEITDVSVSNDLIKRIAEAVMVLMDKKMNTSKPFDTKNIENRGETRPYRSTLKFSNITQNSILNDNTDYILWKEKLFTEFRSRGCLHFVDEKAAKPTGVKQDEIAADRAAVECAIRERLDDKHLRIIKGKTIPVEMIKALDDYRDPVGPLAAIKLWDRFHKLRYEVGKETAREFACRFDEVVDQLSRKAETPDEMTVKRQWLLATAQVCPNLMTREQAMIQMNDGKGMTAAQYKTAFLEVEATNVALQQNIEPEKAFKGEIRKPRNDKLHWHKEAAQSYKNYAIKCTNCGIFGHFKSECKSGNRRLCYSCNKLSTHIQSDCPLKKMKNMSEKKQFKSEGENGLKRKAKENATASSAPKKSKKRVLVSFKHAKKSQKNYAHFATEITEVDGEHYFVLDEDIQSDDEGLSVRFADARDRNDEAGTSYRVNCEYDFDSKNNQVDFVADSGATEHLVNQDEHFIKTKDLTRPKRIICANKDSDADILIRKMGMIPILTDNDELGRLENVLFSKHVSENLLSLRKLVARGLEIYLSNKGIIIFDKNGRIVKTGDFDGKLWRVIFEVPNISSKEFEQAFEHAFCALPLLDSKDGGSSGQGESETRESTIEGENIENKIKRVKSILGEHGYSKPSLKVPAENTSNVTAKTSMNDHVYAKPAYKNTKMSNDNRIKENSPPIPLQNDDSNEGIVAQEEVSSEQLSYKDISNVNSLQKYLEIDCDMNLKDLKDLDEKQVLNLRNRIGLLWHYRLNHNSKTYLDIASKVIPNLKGVKFDSDIIDCEACRVAKIKRNPSIQQRFRATKPLQIIHSDLMTISPKSFKDCHRYIVTFTDDFSRFSIAYTLIDKTTVHFALQDFLRESRVILGQEVKIGRLRTDGGTEYETSSMKRVMAEEKITFQKSEPHTPEHNATAERLNREIQEKVRALLYSAKMPVHFWPFALHFMIHVHNRTPKASINFRTPYELFYGRKPNLKYIRRFGCLAFELDLKNNSKSKFAPQANRGFLVQCNETGYTILDPTSGKTFSSKHVQFVESKVYGDFFDPQTPMTTDPPSTSTPVELTFGDVQREGGRIVNISTPNLNLTQSQNVRKDYIKVPAEPTKSETKELLSEAIAETLNTENEFSLFTNVSNEYDDENCNNEYNFDEMTYSFLTSEDLGPDPPTYLDAMNSPDKDKWMDAIKSELDSLKRNKTWILVDRLDVPKGVPIIKSRWVNKRKIEPNNKIRYKSRLVVKGFADKNKYDTTETYAPVARISDVRLMLAVANKYDLDIRQMDVKTAFLNGELEKEVYMELPEGYECNENVKRKKVCKLKRALYGLKVSPKRWYEKFKSSMLRMNFKIYPFQSCLFSWRKGERFVFVLLYVDDILIIGNCENKIMETMKKLKGEYEMTDLGSPKKFLGIEIIRDRKNQRLFLSQRNFIENILKRFDMTQSVTVNTPMRTNEAEKKTNVKVNENNFKLESIPFRQAVGSLLYLANATRPDIAFAVNALSRKQSNYDENDWNKVKRVIKYLKGTISLGLLYEGKEDNVICYADASLGTNDEEGKSTSGYVIKIFGDLINWRTKKQSHVALSSAEAEFIAMSFACKDLVNLNEICKRLLHLNMIPILYEDNQAAIKLAKNEDSQSLKHIVKLCYHYIRLEIKNRNLILKWVSTKDQLADFFTKALPEPKFRFFREQLLQDLEMTE